MIRLDISKYCSNCPGFDPVVEKNVLRGDGGIKMVDTVVTCKNAARCRNIYSYILNEHKNNTKNGRNTTSFLFDEAPVLYDHEIL